jgi:tetratricopeptide (TPR) repeat protein
MKAERRHELQENSLARFIDNLPVMMRLYADRILLAVVLVLLVVVLIRWRMNQTEARATQTANDLAEAKASVTRLQRMPMIGPPDQLVATRNRAIDEVNTAIDTVANNASSTDRTLQSQALLTRGDLNWTLANSPSIPGAATQPTLQLQKSSEEYLQQAEDAYQQVLKSFPDQKEAALSATFGLAAIAENRHNWDEAARLYNQIKNSDAEKMYKDLADARLKLLPDIQAPVLLGSLTTKPADLTPLVLAPTSQPATQPVPTPATQPAH